MIEPGKLMEEYSVACDELSAAMKLMFEKKQEKVDAEEVLWKKKNKILLDNAVDPKKLGVNAEIRDAAIMDQTADELLIVQKIEKEYWPLFYEVELCQVKVEKFKTLLEVFKSLTSIGK